LEGIQGPAEVFETQEEAELALGSLPSRTKQSFTLGGMKDLVVSVHHIKVKWLPINEGHIGYAKLVKAKPETSETKPLPKAVNIMFVVALAATLFDALVSFVNIGVNQIALEANPIQNFVSFCIRSLFGVDEITAFGATMTLRAVVGAALLVTLYLLARFRPYQNERRLAIFGIGVGAVALTAVSLYHVVGMLFLS
jgi:hypothetical protein